MKFLIYVFLLSSIITLLLFLCGCSSTKVQQIKVPIPVHGTKIVLWPRPRLPIWDLNKNSSYADVSRAYASSLKIALNDDDQCRMAILASQ